LSEQDLGRWRLVEQFQARLREASELHPLAATWAHGQRGLHHDEYLSLFLFGLLNPVVRTMRGLCEASGLQRVQEEICGRPVSLGSFSEAQAVIDPALLAEVFARFSAELPDQPKAAGRKGWLVQDSSLFEALPRMHWALWRRQGTAQAQVRLHLSLQLDGVKPARAVITPGGTCERAVWRGHWQRGDAYVGDRYYGEDYAAFGQMQAAGVAFVVRLRDEAVFNVEEELAVSQQDQRVGVIRAAWGWLGSKARYRSIRVRVVWVQTPREVLRLVTNLAGAELSAGDVALLYQQRWQVELFFRWIKCILGCRHWLAESPRGAQVQIYLALIAAVLLQLYTGRRPSKRMMETIQFYLLGIATLEELCAAVERENARTAKKKN
jgi:hypothetical protein